MRNLLTAALTCLLLASCSKDKTPQTTNPLVSTWELTRYSDSFSIYGYDTSYPETKRSLTSFTPDFKVYTRYPGNSTINQTTYSFITSKGIEYVMIGTYDPPMHLPSGFTVYNDTLITLNCTGGVVSHTLKAYYRRVSSNPNFIFGN